MFETCCIKVMDINGILFEEVSSVLQTIIRKILSFIEQMFLFSTAMDRRSRLQIWHIFITPPISWNGVLCSISSSLCYHTCWNIATHNQINVCCSFFLWLNVCLWPVYRSLKCPPVEPIQTLSLSLLRQPYIQQY